MLGKRVFTLGSVVGVIAIICSLLKKIHCLRVELSYQLVERVQERLDNIEKQLFQDHHSQKTRENIHRAIKHVSGWDYLCDTEDLALQLSRSITMLDMFMSVDKEGKLAYLECRDSLRECISLIDEFSLEDTFFEKLKRRFFSKKDFNKIMERYDETLDDSAYVLNDLATEVVLRPIYPYEGDWYPEDLARKCLDGMFSVKE